MNNGKDGNDKEVIETWEQLMRNHAKMEQLVLEILRHPDATAKDIMRMRAMYRDACERLDEAYDSIVRKVKTKKPILRRVK